jgi:hypothetical protein
MAGDQSAEFLAAFISAWERSLPNLVCPLKLQDGVLYFRALGDDSSEVWRQKTDADPQARWRAVQRDATGNDYGALEGNLEAVLAKAVQCSLSAASLRSAAAGKHHSLLRCVNSPRSAGDSEMMK